MKELLSQSWVGSAIGLVGIPVGIVVGIIIAYYFRARPRIASQVNSLELLGNNPVLPKEIDFLFRGQKVPKVTLSRVAIWNKGNTTLRRDQIVMTDPLRIVTSSESQILEARILNRTREVNDFTCSVLASGNEVECAFDYLDTRDGALLELIHTGDDKVQVVGTLREVPKGVLVIAVPKTVQQKKQAQLTRFGTGVLGVVVILLGLGLLLVPLFDPNALLGALLTAPFLVILGVAALSGVNRIPPRQLNTQITSSAPPSRSPWYPINLPWRH